MKIVAQIAQVEPKINENSVFECTLGIITSIVAALVDFGASEERLGRSWARLGGVLGASWRRLGRILRRLGRVLAGLPEVAWVQRDFSATSTLPQRARVRGRGPLERRFYFEKSNHLTATQAHHISHAVGHRPGEFLFLSYKL